MRARTIRVRAFVRLAEPARRRQGPGGEKRRDAERSSAPPPERRVVPFPPTLLCVRDPGTPERDRKERENRQDPCRWLACSSLLKFPSRLLRARRKQRGNRPRNN